MSRKNKNSGMVFGFLSNETKTLSQTLSKHACGHFCDVVFTKYVRTIYAKEKSDHC